jgi:hypothetical protein
VNIKTYLNHQMAEDRRAFVIHHPAKSGKTRFAHRICELRSDVHYLDLQKYFLENENVPPVSDCDPDTIKKLLLQLKVSQPIIIVDNPDFLFNTWDQEEKLNFLSWLNRTLRSPAMTEKTFVVILQDDPALSSITFDKNFHREERLLPLNHFDSI